MTMNLWIGVAVMASFGLSLAGYCWMRRPDVVVSRFDGDPYEVDEMLAAFGTNQDWV